MLLPVAGGMAMTVRKSYLVGEVTLQGAAKPKEGLGKHMSRYLVLRKRTANSLRPLQSRTAAQNTWYAPR